MDTGDKRTYARGEHFHIEAKTSRDKARWKKVTINNLSSGGLQLLTEDKYEIGDKIWFDLVVQGFFSQFEARVQGEIRNARVIEHWNAYGVVFLDLSHDKKIMIDENIHNDRPIEGNPYSYDF